MALRLRLLVFQLVVVLTFGILAAQLWNMQIIHGAEYADQAENNRLRVVPIAAARGVIYDRNGVQLVSNVPSFTVTVTVADLPEEGPDRDTMLERLGGLIGMARGDIKKRIVEAIARDAMFSPIPLVANASDEMALAVEENAFQLPGIAIQVDANRRYIEGDDLAHILGYVSSISAEEYDRLANEGYLLNDRLGKAGVERTYETTLRGRLGSETAVYDAAGEKIITLSREEPIPGKSLALTIDIELQSKMREILEKTRGNSEQSVGIAMDPRSGEILAMVSLPGYDNNFFSKPLTGNQLAGLINDSRKPLLNHALSSSFPPGSTFKPIVGAGALQEGVATPNTQIFSEGFITVRNQFDPSITYRFDDNAAHGLVDFRRAMAVSSNVYFYYLSGGFEDEFTGLGARRLANYARMFGLGSPSGIDLPAEASGTVPDPDWKLATIREPWLLGDTYNYGIGQGYLNVTPIQLLNMISIVANGGTRWRPAVVKDILDSDGSIDVPFSRVASGTVEVAPKHLQVIREALREAVLIGSGVELNTISVESSGKTGTAELSNRKPVTGDSETHGWFAGYAPSSAPEIAILIFHEEGAGSFNATPAAAEFFEFWDRRRAASSGRTVEAR